MARSSGVAGGGGATTLDGLTDAVTVSEEVGQVLEYADGKWRNANPEAFHLRRFISDQLAGAAYVPSYRIYGCSITSGAAVLTVKKAQFTAAMVGQTIYVDQAGAAGAVLTTTVLSFTSSISVTLAANASSTVTDKGVSRIFGTNISVALNAALTACAALPPLGAVLVIPGGEFYVDGDHQIADYHYLRGAGRWRSGFMLKPSAGTDVDVFQTVGFDGFTGQSAATNANMGTQGFRLEGFHLDGNFRSNASARNGLSVYGFDYELKDFLVTSAKKRAIWSELSQITSGAPHQTGTGPGGLHAYWDRVMVQNSGDSEDQIYFQGPHDSYIRGLDVYKDGSFSDNGIYSLAGGSQWAEIHVWGNHTIGMNLAAGGQLFENLQSEGGNLQLRIGGTKIKGDHARLYGVTGTSADEGMELPAQAGNCQLTNITFEDFDVCAVRFSGGGGNDSLITGVANSSNGTPPPLIAGTVHETCEMVVVGTGGYDRSIRKIAGHAVVAGDVAVSAGWGTTATPTVRAGSNVYRGEITVASAGTGQGANPTVTLTFPRTFTATPYIVANRSGTIAGGSSGFTADNITTTSVRFTYGGTPSAATSYSLSWVLVE